MQTLGLASEQKPTDGLFKRLLWPTIENGYDVELVSKQGFWLCVIVAILSTLSLVATGHAFFAVLVGLTYFLAGVGVRERSLAAAILIFCCYLLDRIASYAAIPYGFGAGSPVIGIVGVMLLFANVRATVLARTWRRSESFVEAAEFPERVNDSFSDRFANVWPGAIWPRGQFVFYPIATALLMLTLTGMVVIARQKHVQPAPARSAPAQSMQIEVRPQ